MKNIAAAVLIFLSFTACGPAMDKATDTSGTQGTQGVFRYQISKVPGTTNSQTLVVLDAAGVRQSFTVMGLNATEPIPPTNPTAAIRVQHVMKSTVANGNPLVVNFLATDTRMVVYEDANVGGGTQVSTARELTRTTLPTTVQP